MKGSAPSVGRRSEEESDNRDGKRSRSPVGTGGEEVTIGTGSGVAGGVSLVSRRSRCDITSGLA
jgi:hypothetical protein